MRSFWLEQALKGETDLPPLEGSQRADVCIVGGGFTGLWTALRLKELEPSLDVAIVEADVCGAGASGRNGGFILSWWAKYLKLEQMFGQAEALRLAHASAEAVYEIGRFCAEHGIAADYRADGWLWAASTPHQLDAWVATVEALNRVGERPFQVLEPAEAARISGSARHVGGVFEPSAATVQPAALARGMRRVALARGVRIYEHSPMRRLERSQPPKVHTPAGAITADRVVLALNAWGAGLPDLRRVILVVGSDVVATEPAPELLKQTGWTNGLSISDSRFLVHYYRNTPDGRIVLGKGGRHLAFAGRVGAAFEGQPPRPDEVLNTLRWLYPAFAQVPAARVWTGPVGRTMSGLPLFTRLGGRPDIIFGGGYSGNGVGPSVLGGRILAAMVLDRQDEWGGCGLVRTPEGYFPPEPFRYVGGMMVRAAIARIERAYDAGRRPAWYDQALANLAPPGLVPNRKHKGV